MNQDKPNQTKFNQNQSSQGFKNLPNKDNFKNKQKFKENRNPNKERFQGESESLKENFYFVGSTKQADNYNVTIDTIL